MIAHISNPINFPHSLAHCFLPHWNPLSFSVFVALPIPGVGTISFFFHRFFHLGAPRVLYPSGAITATSLDMLGKRDDCEHVLCVTPCSLLLCKSQLLCTHRNWCAQLDRGATAGIG